MAERRTITISEVDKSRDNRVGVKDDQGRWYGCFDRKLWDRLTPGAHLNIEMTTTERDGRTYYNLAGILGTAPSPNGAAPASDRERNIIRESALSSACTAVAFLSTGDDPVAAILAAAERFERWISRTEKAEDDEAPF